MSESESSSGSESNGESNASDSTALYFVTGGTYSTNESQTDNSNGLESVMYANYNHGNNVNNNVQASPLEMIVADGKINGTALEYALNNGYSLEAIAAYITGKNQQSGNTFGYAVHTDRRPTSEDYSELSDAIAYERGRGNLPSTRITENPEIVQYHLDAWLDALDDFKADPAKYRALQDYSRSIGREIAEPLYAGVYDSDTMSGARTVAGKTIEANIDMDSMISNISSETGISALYLQEMLIAHEYFHNGQPSSVLYGEPFPYVAELDVEYNMAQFFKGKSGAANNDEDRANYANLARYCNARYEYVKYAMANGIDLKPENTIETVIE